MAMPIFGTLLIPVFSLLLTRVAGQFGPNNVPPSGFAPVNSAQPGGNMPSNSWQPGGNGQSNGLFGSESDTDNSFVNQPGAVPLDQQNQNGPMQFPNQQFQQQPLFPQQQQQFGQQAFQEQFFPPQQQYQPQQPFQQQQQSFQPDFQQEQPQNQLSNLDTLTMYALDFLTSLSKEQLTAFLRVYFMSKMVGSSFLDLRSREVLTRSAKNTKDQRAIATLRTINAAPSQMTAVDSSQIGAVIGNFASRWRDATPVERTVLFRNYQKRVESMKLPKGVKYALKHVL